MFKRRFKFDGAQENEAVAHFRDLMMDDGEFDGWIAESAE